MNNDRRILIIKAGRKLPSLARVAGDFDHWILDAMQVDHDQAQVVSVFKDELLPEIQTVSAVIITGSGAMVSDAVEWGERSVEWLRKAIEQGLPILGICYGHQLLAHALGATVADNPMGVEVGTVASYLTKYGQKDYLLTGLGKEILVQSSHKQTVCELPDNAIKLAYSDSDNHHAFRYGQLAWGLQFHPEFTAEIVEKYIDYYQDALADEDVHNLKSRCQDNNVGNIILQRFAKLAKA